ncbi:uncharacterized protein [Periplaneta americana]|uniref:uncharacterized protein isoform X4 n=1 Tax=Periplaneta americana TaxID=6978 RepID=UPI0037E987FA
MKEVLPRTVFLLLLWQAPSQTANSQTDVTRCSSQDYDICVKMADPLLKDPRLIFPDNRADIDLVCRRWSQFVDCVKRYTDRCFTESRRQEFNKAVESPVDSVHQMCTVTQYQTEYLKHASCIKSTLTREEHCGRHYQHLVDQVHGEASRVGLCCSHLRFRECVLEETRRQCDGGAGAGSAARFSRQMLDKALSFLRDQCYNYIGLCRPRICPTSGECPGLSVLRVDESTGASDQTDATDQLHRPSNQQPWTPQGVGPERRVTSTPEIDSSTHWVPSRASSRDNWTPRGAIL